MKNCRRFPLYLLAIFVLAAVSGHVAASPAYFGYTGLMLTPTADTLKTGGVGLGAVFLTNDNNNTTFWSANVGLLDSLEVGAALVSPEHGDSNGIINAKFGLLKETMATPALAIGVSDLADQLDATPYVVVSKSLPLKGQSLWTPRLHVGVGGGRLDGVFAGLSAKVADRMQLMVEYDTNDVNFGLQFAAAHGLRLHAGLVGGDNLGLGISYNAGF
ncbi:MAG: YjbH domain-containing protein [Armatimonadetes bacterium]|nr:YjbH domain-containing protein [Armatimonadota bacterium]